MMDPSGVMEIVRASNFYHVADEQCGDGTMKVALVPVELSEPEEIHQALKDLFLHFPLSPKALTIRSFSKCGTEVVVGSIICYDDQNREVLTLRIYPTEEIAQGVPATLSRKQWDEALEANGLLPL